MDFPVLVESGVVAAALLELDGIDVVKGGMAPADANCEMFADGILKFTTGESKTTTRVVCGMILATYGCTLGLFDHLIALIVEDAGDVESLRRAF